VVLVVVDIVVNVTDVVLLSKVVEVDEGVMVDVVVELFVMLLVVVVGAVVVKVVVAVVVVVMMLVLELLVTVVLVVVHIAVDVADVTVLGTDVVLLRFKGGPVVLGKLASVEPQLSTIPAVGRRCIPIPKSSVGSCASVLVSICLKLFCSLCPARLKLGCACRSSLLVRILGLGGTWAPTWSAPCWFSCFALVVAEGGAWGAPVNVPPALWYLWCGPPVDVPRGDKLVVRL
jgi:hypothetical protein